MKIKRFFNFFKTKVFLINVLLAVVFTIFLFIGILYFIKSYTRHGVNQSVPNLIGLQIDEVQTILNKHSLNYVISDSVYHDYIEKGAVVEQFPPPDFKVKEGRKIYLITNCFLDEMVEMPSFVGYSLRQVHSFAESYGLNIGQLNYVPDIAVNVVIRQMYRGEEIDPGVRVPKGATIDLMIGLGLSDRKTIVPTLTGLTYREASNRLLEEYLNVGAIIYDQTVQNANDSAKARVYRQSPRRDTINLVNLGYNIDIWLTTEKDLYQQSIDSVELETE